MKRFEMEYLQAVVLALIQGLTEFLPISSSAHLILPSQLFGWKDQGVGFDVAVHVGSLVAVVSYFRRDLFNFGSGTARAIVERQRNPEFDTVLQLGIATVPIALCGWFAASYISSSLRTITVISITTIAFAFLLWGADARSKRLDEHASVGFLSALVIGLFQVLALVPGTSRSGITITAGLLLGLSRFEASRFAFLLAIPTIAASAVLLGLDGFNVSSAEEMIQVGLGFAIAAITAFCCIAFFLRFVERVGMMPFVLYRLLLGGVLLLFL